MIDELTIKKNAGKADAPLNPLSSSSSLEALRLSFRHAAKIPVCCPLCGGNIPLPLTFADRHDLGLNVVMCQRCGMGMISPRPDSTWFDQFYRKDYWSVYLGSRFKDFDDMYIQDQCAERSRQIFEAIHVNLRYSPRNYLDVGCGQGAMLVEFRERYPAASCSGVEPSPDAAAFCFRRHGLKVESRPLAALDTEELRGPFDLITLIHVLEHALDPVGVLTRTADLLLPNGLIYVEVPDLLSERWSGKDFFHIAHVWYFHETALRNLFLRCGLEVVEMIRGAAEIWPWAIGFVGQKSFKKLQPPEAVPAAPLDFIERLRDHLAVRGVPPALQDLSSQKRLAGLISPQKFARFLRKWLVPGREAPREEVCSLQEHSSTPEKTPDIVTANDADPWLYVNRAERMDALDTSGVFPRDRQAFHRSRYEFALDYVEGLEIADIGCGLGYGCRILKEGGAKTVTGIDICPEAIQYARSKHWGEGVRFIAGDATRIPLASSSVDVIISFETLEHVPDTTVLLAEFHRVLQPKGRLIVSSPNDWGLTEHHCHTWTPFELKAEIADFFEIESTWEQVSISPGSKSASPNGIRTWSKATEPEAECIIVIGRKTKQVECDPH